MAKKLKIKKSHSAYKFKMEARRIKHLIRVFRDMTDADQLEFLGSLKHTYNQKWDLSTRKSRNHAYESLLRSKFVYDVRMEEYQKLPAATKLKIVKQQRDKKFLGFMSKLDNAEIDKLETLAQAESIVNAGIERDKAS